MTNVQYTASRIAELIHMGRAGGVSDEAILDEILSICEELTDDDARLRKRESCSKTKT